MNKCYFNYVLSEKQEETFLDNQYEEYNNGIFPYKEQIIARYISQDEPTYVNNMLIEALPPIYSLEQIFMKIQKLPLYSEMEREKDEGYRIQAITRLEGFVSVFIKHIEIEKKLAAIIRRGYASKHKFTFSEFQRDIGIL